MTKKSRTTPSEETWRECPGITDSGRLFVSSAGNVKFQPSIHHDGQTGRPYVLIDGRPVFLDSLVLSMFGDGGRPRRCYDISHADGSPDNCSVSNLEWTSSRLRTGGALSDSTPVNVSYLMQRTVTPEMVQDREYPIVNPAPAAEYSIFDKDINLDVRSAASTDSGERKPSATLAGLSQRISDIEDRLDRRPKDDDAVIRRLSKYIVEDMIGINPHLRTLTDRYDYDDRTEKYLKRLDVPYGYTVIRRREDNRWVWYRVNIQVLRILDVIYSDVRAGKKPADLLDVHKIRWRPYGKGEYEYLGDYIFDGNEISEEDDRSDMKQDDRTGFNTKRNYGETDRGRLPDSLGVKDIDKNGAVPNNECRKSGQADVRDRSSMKRSYDTDTESDALEEYDEESVGQSVESSDGPGSGMSADVRSTSVNASSVKISPDGYGDVRDVIVNRREYDFGLEDVPETGD